MSRITDYVLEPNIVYTNGSFLIKVKVQDDYKYKKYLVSESMKYTTATGTTFTLTNAVSTNNASILTLQGNTTQNGTPTPTSPIEVSTVSGDNEVVVCGKNRLINKSLSQTYGGVNYTVNDDKSITLNGTSTTNFVVELNNNMVLEQGQYTLSLKGKTQGCGVYAYVGSGTLKAYVSSYNTAENWQSTFTLNEQTTFTQVRIDIQNGKTFNNITIYPQLEKSSQATTYEPYTGNSYRVDFGGKNKLNNTATTQTINGITFTVNSDKSVTVNGTATAHSLLYLGSQTIPVGTYTLSGCPKNGSWSTYSLGYGNYNDSGNGNTFTLTSSLTTNPYIRIGNGTTVSNLTFYPQLEKRKCSNSL